MTQPPPPPVPTPTRSLQTPVHLASLSFCSACGSLLARGAKTLECLDCKATYTAPPPKKKVTHSKPSDFPSALRTKHSDVQKVDDDAAGVQEQTIKQPCEKCGVQEVRFYTLQLRSVDEGTTVFYSCPACGHKWSANN